MVEVFDFQKNFTTGKEVRKSKFKDNSLTKGVATIELFDKDNNLVEKTVSNNFINNPFNSAYMYLHMSRLLSKYNYDNSKVYDNYQFGQIQLRSGDFEEDKDTIFMRGDVAGWCPRESTNAGTDITRGTYNITESFNEFTEDGYFHGHMVYDFLTSQGNGTINHVYWTPTTYNQNYYSIASSSYLYVTPNSNVISMGSNATLKMDVKDDLYVYKNSKYYKVKNRTQFLNGIEKFTIDENDPIDDITHQRYRINSNSHVNPTFSYTKGNNNTRTCSVKLELVNTNTGEIEKTVNFDIINDFASIKEWNDSVTTSSAYASVGGIKTCTESGNIYMNMYISGGSLPIVNADGSLGSTSSARDYIICYNILKDSWIIQPNIKDYNCFILASQIYDGFTVKIDNDTHMYFRNDNKVGVIKIINEKDFTLETYEPNRFSITNLGSSTVNYFNALVGYDYKTNTCIGYGGTGSQLIFNRFLPYTSHTKLPSPVTKTNTTTMKVTYDYYIQVPNMFAEKGKEFEWDLEG